MSLFYYFRNLIIDTEPAFILLVGIAGLALFLANPAAGQVIEVHQGDVVYMNETVDIRQAVAYPKFQVAWCSGYNYDCDPPDQIIDIAAQGNMKSYWIDPSVFKYGDYFRWDGSWHRGENADAFTILPGKRPAVPQGNTTTNTTSRINRVEGREEGPFHYLIARGDTPTVYTYLNRSDTCHLWVFGESTDLYNLPMIGNMGLYQVKLTSKQTTANPPDEFLGYIQCDGRNGIQDVFLDNMTLDTPYDDNRVPDVDIVGWNLGAVRNQFDQLSRSFPAFDDALIPISVTVADPSVTITDVQKNDEETKLYLSGTTTWDNHTAVTIKLDPDNYALTRDIQLHTWQTFPDGTTDQPRRFFTALNMTKEDLYVGAHEIVMRVDKGGYSSETSHTFKVTDVYVMPTPTPMIVRHIYGADYEEIPVIVPTTIPTPEPTVIETVTLVPVTTATPDANATPTLVPTKNTTATRAVPVAATQTIPTVPVCPALALAAIAVMAVIRRE